VDEFQRPLYGDPFGVLGDQNQGVVSPVYRGSTRADPEQNDDDVEKDLWGQLEPEAEGERIYISQGRG
jgi:hypothetical protein